jgi:nucleoside 2-deoxyribosyltransferase
MKVYLCGGIASLTDEDAKGWREMLKESIPEIEWLDPMTRDYRNINIDYSLALKIVEEDLRDIEQSDVVVVNATTPSWGTAMEIVYASDTSRVQQIMVMVGETKNVSPWLQAHATHVFHNWNDLIRKLKIILVNQTATKHRQV